MMKEKRDSIEGLSRPLKDIFNYARREFESSVELAYGADDTLVLVATDDVEKHTFRNNVGNAVSEITDNDAGFLLSDGPDEYEDNVTAYITESPDNAYNYALGLCTELGIGDEETNRIFNLIYNNTGGEGLEAKKTCAGFIYFLSSETDINDITDAFEISKEDVQKYAMKASDEIQ